MNTLLLLIIVTQSLATSHTFLTVKPVGHLVFSRNVLKTGEKVNLTCVAEGYPPNFSFEVTHEGNQIKTEPLPGGNGVYYTIHSAEKNDSGEYKCFPKTTLTEYPSEPLQGDAVSETLTVYGKFSTHRKLQYCCINLYAVIISAFIMA